MGKWFLKGQSKMNWYRDTRSALLPEFGPDVDVFIQFLAATSINATVQANVRLALKAFDQWKKGEDFYGFLPVVVRQLRQVANGTGLTGRKIKNFADAFSNPNAVVVDRWMLRAGGLQKEGGATPGQYNRIEKTVKRMAKKRGLEPRQIQAAVWFGIKDSRQKNNNQAPPFEVLVREMRQ